MSGLVERCLEHFDTSDLYQALGVAKNVPPSEVKKAYYKLSLRVHPDRAAHAGDKEAATAKFQTLSRIYCLLSDKEKRAVYDETGDVGDEGSLPENRDWSDYWRLLFRKVTPKQIGDFEKEYQGSDAEVADLKQAYLDAKGSMEKIIDTVLCATESDEERFRRTLDELIAKGALPKFKSYGQVNTKKQARRKKWAAEEAEEAERQAKRLGLTASTADGESDEHEGSLLALIKRNQKSRQEHMDSFLSGIEAKYSSVAEDEGDDDATPGVSVGKKSRGQPAARSKRAGDGATSAKAKGSSSKSKA